MGKLPKIISVILSLIFVFSGCGQKYDVVDHKDYSSALLEEISSNGELDFYSSDMDGFSSIVSYDELVSGNFSSESASASSSNSLASNSSVVSNITSQKPSTSKPTFTSKPTTTKPVTTTSKPTSSSTPSTPSAYTPTYYSTMKAVWLSYYNFYYDIKGKTASSFRSYAKNIMKTVKDFGFNTIIVHLRSHGDAVYESAYYPWSSIVGKNPGFDPTQILIEEAHAQNLSFHAWFNPLRLSTTKVLPTIDDKFQTKKWYNTKLGDYVVAFDGYYYLNPAYKEVRTLIINGAKEIAQKYKVDALHIDDYFYPTTNPSFDSKAYASLGGGNTLAYFRRNNVNTLIRGIYSAIKGVNSKLKFGISPGGNIERNKNELYADTTTWLQYSGYMDYCIPQIYWNYEHKTHDFKKITNQWKALATNNSVDLIIGLGYYKVGDSAYNTASEGDEWVTDYTVIARQVKDCKTLLGSKYKGFAIFDYDELFESSTTFRNNAKNELKKVM